MSAKSVIFIDWLLISLAIGSRKVCSRIPCIIIIIAHSSVYCIFISSLLLFFLYVWNFYYFFPLIRVNCVKFINIKSIICNFILMLGGAAFYLLFFLNKWKPIIVLLFIIEKKAIKWIKNHCESRNFRVKKKKRRKFTTDKHFWRPFPSNVYLFSWLSVKQYNFPILDNTFGSSVSSSETEKERRHTRETDGGRECVAINIRADYYL